jgi:hypothetical protein
MQDNFNIHGWRLNQAIKEVEEATFTNKHDDNPKLKGGQKKLPDELQAQIVKKEASLNEDEDHEVAMAKSSLQSIMSSASKLMIMLGDEERNIPGWIQDHITNAENYIDQAAQGFHELKGEMDEAVAEGKEKVDEGLGIVSAITILIASLLVNPISGPMIIGLFKYLFQDLPKQRRAAKELRAYNGPDKKEQVLALAKEIESQLSPGKKKYLTSLVNIIGKAKFEDEAKAYQELDLYAKRQKNLMNRELNENLNVDLEAALEDLPIPSNETRDEAVAEDYDFDAQSFGGALKSNNPEGDALVLRFLKGIAKKFDYPVAQAAIFVKERIKKLGY